MTSEPAFPLNAWVWVKQPDYPWWPAMVVDPAQVGQELPEGCDLVLLCGPTAAATLAFANASDAAQVRAFQGEEADAALIEEGRADESCGTAIDEMLAAVSAGAAEKPAAPAPSPGNKSDDDVDWEALVVDAEAEMASSHDRAKKKHKKDKKSKKEKSSSAASGAAKATREERKKRHRHHRTRAADHSGSEADANSRSDGRSGDEDDTDGDSDSGDDGLFRRRHGAASARTAAKKAKYQRQSHLEEYDTADARQPAYSPPNDPTFFYRKVRDARRSATSAELVRSAAELRAITGRCLNGAATAAEVEAAVLRELRSLTCLDVTLAQLQESGIGVAVGGLLRTFTPPVVQLAQAILTYWFHSLPQNTQQALSAETEVDRASVDTCASGDSGAKREGELRRLGVTLYDSFTNEEINDAPPHADVVESCRLLEEELEKQCDADAQMHVLAAFGKDASTGKSLRRLLLAGRITAGDVVKHANDLPALVRTHERRPPRILTDTSNLSLSIGGSMGSPTSPNEVFSPSGDGATGSPTFGSPTGNTTTALYTCPHCGANDAYHSSYTVQAHDSMPDILRCKKCGMTWNVSDQ